MTTTENDPVGLRPRAFAKRTGFGERAIYNALRTGELPHIKINGRYVVLVKQAERMWKDGGLADNQVKSSESPSASANTNAPAEKG